MRYRLLRNSGLRVSEAALGARTQIELGFPYDLSVKEMVRTFAYGGLREQILA
jgi:hypothetical protein